MKAVIVPADFPSGPLRGWGVGNAALQPARQLVFRSGEELLNEMGRVQRGGGSGESCRSTYFELKLGLGEADQGSSANMSDPASPSWVQQTLRH